jgi:hypothetical protein
MAPISIAVAAAITVTITVAITVAIPVLELDALLPGHGCLRVVWKEPQAEDFPVYQGCASADGDGDGDYCSLGKRGDAPF